MTHRLSWYEVIRRSGAIAAKLKGNGMLPPRLAVYGIPRGGCTVAALLGPDFRIVDRPDEADVFVDDVIDSARTRDRYQARFDRPFHALVNKLDPTEPLREKWIVFPWEGSDESSIEDAIVRQLQFIGEDPARDGLRETPARVARALREMTAGYSEDPKLILSKQFEVKSDELIVVKRIPFWSLCEHHLLPFHGNATVGYIPGDSGKVVGLSKLARLVHCFARRLQVQERMTREIAEAITTHLGARGAGCVVEAEHTCMSARGIRTGAPMITSSLLGVLRDAAREEFLALSRA